jgi:hypothetical protein
MADRDGRLHEVLDGYAKFLQEKKLALDKHQPYLVRWVLTDGLASRRAARHRANRATGLSVAAGDATGSTSAGPSKSKSIWFGAEPRARPA